MYDIVYVFKNNRLNSFVNKTIQAKDMYYGLPFFSNFYNVKVIEFRSADSNKFLTKLDRVLSKTLSLPIYFSKIISFKNFKILKNTKNIVLVNESVACSLMPILICLKVFSKKNINVFVMGLYSKDINYKFLKIFHNLYIKLVKACVSNILFLGKGEYQKAKIFHKSNRKLAYFPFCIDTEFWNRNYQKQDTDKKHIIFVGNDSNKDFEKVKLISKQLPELDFKIISNNKIFDEFHSKNVEVIKGEWGKNYLEDEDLRHLYLNSKLSIIPLFEGTQPSGQSVALQSMSMGVPVLISKTKGFWDPEIFKHNKNIYFVSENSVEDWVSSIKYCLENYKNMIEISTNAKTLVEEEYNLDIFYNNLSKYIN